MNESYLTPLEAAKVLKGNPANHLYLVAVKEVNSYQNWEDVASEC